MVNLLPQRYLKYHVLSKLKFETKGNRAGMSAGSRRLSEGSNRLDMEDAEEILQDIHFVEIPFQTRCVS